MTGAEAATRYDAVTIYRIARKTTARVRARDLIPPAIAVPPSDLALLEATGANIAAIIKKARAESMQLRVAKWWDGWAGPVVRRLQAVMFEKLQRRVARVHARMWSNQPMRLMVDGVAYDPHTGSRLN